MNDCAYEDFLKASAGYAKGNKSVSGKLSGKQRCAGRQRCYGKVKWQCTARMTRARVVELTAMDNCPVGDVACVRFKK